MGSVADDSPLIVILGQTASGKSALAIDLAQRFNGEIIAADSRTIYRGLDIGTAKPSLDEQQLVRHHLIDVVDPNQSFSVADFQRLANQAITEIVARGKIPFLVGGSGLYIDSVIYDFSFRRPPYTGERERHTDLSIADLQMLLEREGIPLPANSKNSRHLIRALETKGDLPGRRPLRAHTLVIGLARDKRELEEAIERRVDAMVEQGFIDEVTSLANHYGWETPALLAPGYKAFRLFLAGQSTLEQAKRQFVQYDLQYAKRQKTWFKRNSDIHWISNPEEAVDLVTTLLNK